MITQKSQTVSVTASANSVAQKPFWRSRLNSRVLLKSFRTLKGQFILLALMAFLFSLVLALTLTQAFQQANNDMQTVAGGSVPSVDAAQSMAQFMEDIDAKAADYLATSAFTTSEPCNIVGYSASIGSLHVHDCDDRNITAEITQANQQLYLAAHNVTYLGERTAIERIMAGFEEYIGDIAIMRSEYAQAANVANPQDPHMLKARAAYQQANSVLSQHINQLPLSKSDGSPIFSEPNVPTCTVNGQLLNALSWALSSISNNLDCLSGINKQHLDAAYREATANMFNHQLLAVIGNILFWLLLGYCLSRMAFMTHRAVNLGLLLALVGSLVLGIGVISHVDQLNGRHGDFGQIVKDDYESIYAASLLQRYGTAANADESRWLISLEYNDQADADHWAQDWQNNTKQVSVLMANARNNQTWDEEIQPLADMQKYWQQYLGIDGTLRSTATNTTDPKHILNAETLSTGPSNLAFGKFSDAVSALSDANRLHYKQTLQDASGYLSFLALACALVFPVVGLCAVWGVYLRLKDF